MKSPFISVESNSSCMLKTNYSEIYDCVDFYKQPAFDHPLLQNHTFHPKMRASSIPRTRVGKKLFKEHSESNLIPVGCPVGTVPIKRTTRADIIRAKLHSEKYGSDNMANLGHHYAIAKTKFHSRKKYIGAATEIGVWNPPVLSSQYSSSRLKIQNGEDSIEAGWTVNPTLYGHTKTHLYIYANAGQVQCFNTRYPGFVIVNKDIPIDLVLEETVCKDGQCFYIPFLIRRDMSNGNWWLHIGAKLVPIGFWPRQLFTGLSDMATTIEWGGEVFSPQNVPSPPMGSGEATIIYNTGHDAICALLSTIDEGDTTLEAATDTELYNDDPHYDIKDAGFSFRDLGHVVLFGGRGGALE